MEVNQEIKNSSEIFCKQNDCEVKGHHSIVATSSADSGPTSGGNLNPGRFERKKKTRRGKPKGKNFKPYSKESNKSSNNVEHKPKRLRQRGTNSRLTYEQPEAPNNSNQFLIEDHNFHHIPHLSPKTGGIMLQTSHRKCNRDSSFTSVESDEDNFYSSPEDEEEFLTKEFSETYKDLHEESLGNMSKNDLIRQILSLEEKIELLTKKRKPNDDEEPADEILPQEKIEALECENNWLKREVERLSTENNILRRRRRSSSESSIDSESDSSSTSSSTSTTSSNSKPASPFSSQLNGEVHENPVVNMEEDPVEPQPMSTTTIPVSTTNSIVTTNGTCSMNGVPEKTTDIV